MTRDELLAFARRDWAAVAESKRDFQRERAKSLDPLARFAIVDGLRAQVHAQRPDFPSTEQRAADLEGHILLADRLKRASAG